jgi:hypothetical protein
MNYKKKFLTYGKRKSSFEIHDPFLLAHLNFFQIFKILDRDNRDLKLLKTGKDLDRDWFLKVLLIR